MLEDGLPTATSKAQNALEKKLLALYQVPTDSGQGS
jgi:hypothetical protein